MAQRLAVQGAEVVLHGRDRARGESLARGPSGRAGPGQRARPGGGAARDRRDQQRCRAEGNRQRTARCGYRLGGIR
ncbi:MULTISPECIES: hypothetical protein [Streptomyces]|uniref:hypothetical protein n=1 Tax=Streptomyces lycopersici TaxID=2974589 RepID=UPI003524785A